MQTDTEQQLEMNTRLIDLLRDARNSLAAQNRAMIEALHMSTEEAVAIVREFTRQHKAPFAPSLHDALDALFCEMRKRASQFNAHKYADLLESCSAIDISPAHLQVRLQRWFDGGAARWGIWRGSRYDDSCDETWTGTDWEPALTVYSRKLHFPTPEAALAYLEARPEILENNCLTSSHPQR